MKTLEEVIENKALFVVDSEKGIETKQMINPEEYSLDFLEEKIKAILYFLYSIAYNDSEIEIYIKDVTNQKQKIFNVEHRKDFIRKLEEIFRIAENQFFRRIPNLPFCIIFKPSWWEKKLFLLHWKVRGLTNDEVENQICDHGRDRTHYYYHEEDEEKIFEEESIKMIREMFRMREEETQEFNSLPIPSVLSRLSLSPEVLRISED